ncbi:MAG: tRNA uridine-5-carboxymethylaminomethyl(34) synthesis GTPase MnmE [Pseudomonadales bacterium]|nr:tRNA uridine-5-carboxymethylaminomethyl(34) synthesis GTPase MnmE [Pseudomonadales bacterium]
MAQLDTDTISAIATPPGRGGVGIVRVSGPAVSEIAETICGKLPEARTATVTNFLSTDSSVLDSGIALYFSAPNSFTGEDVLELQGHGGYQVLNALLRRTLECGARLARPGEFTERAFLNDKVDLLQAEAIADLIEAGSEQAVRSAMRTLQGVFSARVEELVNQLISIRVNVEAAIDFSDEDIDVLADTGVASALTEATNLLLAIFKQANQGALLQEGISVVIAGAPNAGKSSLLNALAGNESAIVTDIPGTTRDLLKEQLSLDGLPVHITDTAGLRESEDQVELEGVRRARQVISQADRILLLIDATTIDLDDSEFLSDALTLLAQEQDTGAWLEEYADRLCVVINKTDLLEDPVNGQGSTNYQEHVLTSFHISAKQGLGIDAIKSYLQSSCGFEAMTEDGFIARERHIQALKKTEKLLDSARSGVSKQLPLELIAEDLRLAQQSLGSITGQVSSDDLLGEIFSSFCIGK